MDKYKFVIELIDIRIRILSNERNFYNDSSLLDRAISRIEKIIQK